ncbi:HTH_Tnp_Tc3_2 domain-containing protein [Trichonephila clavipes]|nr:HTH_Tnp_Tc3_2 domain-containing protein [Trichonephila clavipes]
MDDFSTAKSELVYSITVVQWCQFGSSGPKSTEQFEKLAVDDGRKFAARLSTDSGVLMSASSIRRCFLHHGLRARLPLNRIPLLANHQRLCLQRVYEHRSWQADCLQVVFSYESRFNLWGMMTAFVLDAVPLNGAIQSSLSTDIVAENPSYGLGCDFVSWAIQFATN